MSRSKSDTPAQQPTLELDALQEASWDIWDQKYRLKDHQGESVDKTVSGTWERVADALAELEPKQKAHWRKPLLWALENGAIPAGRITANAGANEYKPATSTNNCKVSGPLVDSMQDILHKNVDAEPTLKPDSGIG